MVQVILISGIHCCKKLNVFQIKSEEKKVDMEGEEKERDPKPGLLGLVILDYIWFRLMYNAKEMVIPNKMRKNGLILKITKFCDLNLRIFFAKF